MIETDNGEISESFKKAPENVVGKLSFVFDPSSLEHKEKLTKIINVESAYSDIEDLCETMRGYLKHGHSFESANKAIESIRNELIKIKLKLNPEEY